VKISVVTTSFNQAQYLEQTIKSVLGQGYVDLEYVIVDPGSTDGSREIIESYRDRIAHIIFERDEGPADGLNRGFARATGDICGYLNSDDILLPGAISRVAEAFRSRPDCDLVYGNGYFIDAAGAVVRRCRSDRFNLRRFAYGNSIVMQQAAFWRRDAFVQVGGFNRANRLSWDGEFWIDLALAKRRFCRVDEYWACFRMHTESISHNFHGGSQSSPFGREQLRLFHKAMGRPWNKGDAIAAVMTRVEKWLVDPENLWLRVTEFITACLSTRWRGSGK
jgi:glycosyltransferase involved in cell wall biosynthesis